MSKAHDEVIKFNNKYLNVNKYNIESFGRVTGYYFCIQEITYIRKLEQNLSKKLREKGQVARYTFDDIKTVSLKMERTKELGMKIAKSDYTVLITGESGTGKELMAQSIHNASPRHSQPFIAINCAAMPENLLESELFGYEEGAFTGALKGGKKGLFEQANNGTIFLDEIGDMPIYLQSKLLRVLQENQVMRVGGENVIDIDVRVIAATNKNLLEIEDPVDSLDISILQDYVIDAILGIDNPGVDKRIDFIGGIRGLEELEKRVNEDMKVAFAMYPTSIEDLIRVADANKIMPAKSTWFEPKVRCGLFLHEINE